MGQWVSISNSPRKELKMEIHLAPRLSLVLGVFIFLSWGGDVFAEFLPGTSVEQFFEKMPA
jgi:hypothetical protein